MNYAPLDQTLDHVMHELNGGTTRCRTKLLVCPNVAPFKSKFNTWNMFVHILYYTRVLQSPLDMWWWQRDMPHTNAQEKERAISKAVSEWFRTSFPANILCSSQRAFELLKLHNTHIVCAAYIRVFFENTIQWPWPCPCWGFHIEKYCQSPAVPHTIQSPQMPVALCAAAHVCTRIYCIWSRSAGGQKQKHPICCAIHGIPLYIMPVPLYIHSILSTYLLSHIA